MIYKRCLAFFTVCILMVCLFSGCVNKDKTVGEILQNYTPSATSVTEPLTTEPVATELITTEPTVPANTTPTVAPSTQGNTQSTDATIATQPTTQAVDPSVIGTTVNSPIGFKSWFRINGEDYISNTLFPLNARLNKVESELTDAKFVNDIYSQYQKRDNALIIRATNNVLYCAEVDYVIPNDSKVNGVYAMGAFSVEPYSFEHSGLFGNESSFASSNVGVTDSYLPKEYDTVSLKAGDSYKMYYLFLLPKGYDKNFCMEFSYTTDIKTVAVKNVFVAVN